MKKYLISTFLISTLFLASCWQEKLWIEWLNTFNPQEINDNNLSETNNQKEEKWDETSGIIEAENSKNNENNEEKIEEVVINNNKKLIMKNNNVFIKEPWKDDVVLTTRATWKNECNDWKNQYYLYSIAKNSWKYWIVKREYRLCSLKNRVITYYFIDLNSNTDELIRFADYEYWEENKFKNDNVIIEWNKAIINIYFEAVNWYYGLYDEIIDRWFDLSKNEDYWIQYYKKEINLSDFNQWKKLSYTDNELINAWYDVNDLWKVKEYYKKEIDENLWFYAYKTIYISQKKQLEVFTYYNSTWSKLDTDEKAYLIISDGLSTVKINDADLEKYWNPLQPIFNRSRNKIIVDSDLNVVKFVGDKSKIAWAR